MNKREIIERLKNIARHAVHTVGEEPFVMSLDDGIAVHEAIELLKKPETNCLEIPREDIANMPSAVDLFPLLTEEEKQQNRWYAEGYGDAIKELSVQPDRGYVEQIKWERDLAIQQLKDLGYGLGEKPRTKDYKTDHGYIWLCPKCGLPVHSDFERCVRCGYERLN